MITQPMRLPLAIGFMLGTVLLAVADEPPPNIRVAVQFGIRAMAGSS